MLSRNWICPLGNCLGNTARRHYIRNFNKPHNASTSVPAAVKYPTVYNSFQHRIVEQPDISQQVASFKRAVRQEISESIDVIRTDSPIRSIGCYLCPHLLFVRRRVHDPLLRAIRKRLHAVVIGNPGIGKSVFQQYYLARIFNEELYGPLPADYFWNTAPPDVVVHQIGASRTELYFVPERMYGVIEGNPGSLLGALEPHRTLLLFEPDVDICEPVWNPEFQTSAFVSPNRSRYKEFVKRGAVELYNPVWDLDEILDVAEVMRSEPSFPNEMQSLYTESAVKERYDEFGGIVRYCLPQHSDVLSSARIQREMALEDSHRSSLIRYDRIEHPEVSHHLALMQVEVTGPEPFKNATIDLVNDDVRDKLRRAWKSVSLLDRIRALTRNDETGYMEKACQDLYEDVVAENLMRKASWRQRVVMADVGYGVDEEEFSSGPGSKRVDGVVPKFENMVERVLYVPLKKNFPLGDMVWKCDDVLYVANATRQSSGSKQVAGVEAFINQLCLSEKCKVRLCIVPKYDMYNKLKVEVPLSAKKLRNLTVVVLEMPKDYGASTIGY